MDKSRQQRIIRSIWSWTKSLAIALLAVSLIHIFLLQPTRVQGNSMLPTLQDHDFILISKLPHTFNYVPEYNDIVIIDSRLDHDRTFMDDLAELPIYRLFHKGSDDTHVWVKRVVGKPGDVLELKGEELWRNGKLLKEPYINEAMQHQGIERYIVPDNAVYVLGDNRNHSADSRIIGSVPIDHVLGKKLF